MQHPPANKRRTPSDLSLADRLRLIRIAYGRIQGFEKEFRKAEFARLCGLTPQAWNNAETGQNQIGIESAIKLCCMTGATLDYIFRGNPAALAYNLAVQIAKATSRKGHA